MLRTQTSVSCPRVSPVRSALSRSLLVAMLVAAPFAAALSIHTQPAAAAENLDVGADVVAKIAESLPTEAPGKPAKPRHLLIFSRTQGFRHGSIPTGGKAITMLGEKTRAFTAVHIEDPSFFDANKLSQFDAVFMLNTTGECLADNPADTSDTAKAVTEQRKKNLLEFVASGKGLVGCHSATDTMYSSKEYGDLVGGWFKNHPWHTDVTIKIDAPEHPLTAMFDARQGFQIKDEIYQFAQRGTGDGRGDREEQHCGQCARCDDFCDRAQPGRGSPRESERTENERGQAREGACGGGERTKDGVQHIPG